MLKHLIIKEFKQLFRGGFIPKLLIFMPIAMIGILPFAANQEIKHLKVTIVDNDKSSVSEKLCEKVSASKYFTLTEVGSSHRQAIKSIEKGDVDLIVEIPDDFEKNLVKNGLGKVQISVNSVNGMKGMLANNYMNSIINEYANEMKEKYSTQQPSFHAQVFSIKPYYLFNPKLDYKIFMVPAIMVMLLTLMCGFLPALNIVGEKEKGTIEQINVTPVTRFAFILSKLIPYWIIGFVLFGFSMFLAWLFYGLTPVGSVFTMFIFVIAYIIAISGFGLVISNYAKTMSQAMFLIFFFMLVFILMSGLFTPVASMPQWAQYIAAANPLKYFIEVMRMIYLKGSGLSALITNLLAIITVAIVLNTWAIISYKKTN